MKRHLIGFLLACLVAVGPAGAAPLGEVKTDSLVIAMNTPPLGIIPATTAGIVATMVGTQVFAGLVRPVAGPPEGFEPYLAESWRSGEDSSSITFTLRKGALFHDNTPISVWDVAFSIRVAMRYHPYGPAFDLIRDIRIEGPRTLTVLFKHPVPSLLVLFSPNFIPILPRHVYGRGIPLPERPIDEIPVGSGPFRMESITDNKIFRLRRFDGFFVEGRPRLASIVFTVFEDLGDIHFALKEGEVDLVGFSHAPDRNRELAEIPGVTVLKSGYAALGVKAFLYFNMERAPFTDIRVRRALNHAVDTRFIRKHIFGGDAVPLNGPFLPTGRFHTPGADHRYPLDIFRANALLDEAGYPRDKGGKRFTIQVESLPNTRQLFIPMLEYLRHSLSRSIGVELRFNDTASLPQWGRKVSTGDYQATADVLFTWSEPILGTHRTHHSKNIKRGRLWANMRNYRNPAVDALLDEAARTVAFPRRKALYGEVQGLITRDAPAIWIGSIPYITAVRKKGGRTLRGVGHGLWGLLSPLDHAYWE